MPPQPNLKRPDRKVLIQPRITDFLVKKSETKSIEKTLVQPTFSFEDANIFCNGHFSPTYEKTAKPIYHTPIIDMNKVVKDGDFYSMDEFKEDEEKLTAVKKSLFDILKSDDTKVKLVDKDNNTISDELVAGKAQDMDAKNKLDVRSLDQQSTKDIEDVVDVSVPQLTEKSTKPKKPRNKKRPPTKLDDVKKMAEAQHHLPDLTNSSEPQPVANRRKRAPNEIQVASLVVPVLLREPSVKDMRAELNSLGIFKPFSFQINGFQERLERLGLEESELFIQTSELDMKSTNLKHCLYCGFLTESSLVLGRHLDVSHKNRFKKWPFSSRMDFNNKYQ